MFSFLYRYLEKYVIKIIESNHMHGSREIKKSREIKCLTLGRLLLGLVSMGVHTVLYIYIYMSDIHEWQLFSKIMVPKYPQKSNSVNS